MPAHSLPRRLVIATRESALALWQARHIQNRLQTLYPALEIKLLGMTTQGDKILDQSLSKIGGKGLFVKELETALADGRADMAVHSMKDVPMRLPDGFIIAAITEREDPHDALVSNRYQRLQDLPPGAIVGTSSLRRESQLRAAFPHLQVQPLRGNVQTRLAKLDAGQYDAIVLAAAGLKRLGLSDRIACILSSDESLPAVGQGALGIEIRTNRPELASLLEPLNHPATADCVTAERAMSLRLNGSCQVPLGCFAEVVEDHFLRVRGFVAKPDGSQILRAEANGSRQSAPALGRQVADLLLTEGAQPLIQAQD
ncbi:hydroxymethylbilane synthase [Parachitinimonas caeni]|uniref:Porphobilinogen deaminase n=1 Tax=Parachitinimonas caeni TaxID=3031301 RepID=A0ABT7DVR0_9NEIS|nr:hydroxymethylbilane synthase [Parachitinimonas caeni]MDK2124094.1 hydroxymethylbilane synthase [Parachitinimonas caeni]